MATLQKFYFTFGFGQRYENCYHVIEAYSKAEARAEMVKKFGIKWAFQYSEKDWYNEEGVSQAEQYNLREIK